MSTTQGALAILGTAANRVVLGSTVKLAKSVQGVKKLIYLDAQLPSHAPSKDEVETVMRLAQGGSADEIDAFLTDHPVYGAARGVELVPPSPGQAVEFLGDHLISLATLRSDITAEDLDNVDVAVFADGDEPSITHTDDWTIFCPGTCDDGQFAVLSPQGKDLSIVVYDRDMKPTWSESLSKKSAGSIKVSQ